LPDVIYSNFVFISFKQHFAYIRRGTGLSTSHWAVVFAFLSGHKNLEAFSIRLPVVKVLVLADCFLKGVTLRKNSVDQSGWRLLTSISVGFCFSHVTFGWNQLLLTRERFWISVDLTESKTYFYDAWFLLRYRQTDLQRVLATPSGKEDFVSSRHPRWQAVTVKNISILGRDCAGVAPAPAVDVRRRTRPNIVHSILPLTSGIANFCAGNKPTFYELLSLFP